MGGYAVGRQVVSLVALAKNKLFLNSSHRSTHSSGVCYRYRYPLFNLYSSFISLLTTPETTKTAAVTKEMSMGETTEGQRLQKGSNERASAGSFLPDS